MIKKLIASSLLLSTLLMAPAALADPFKSYLEAPVYNLDPLFLNTDASRQLGQLVHRGLVSFSPTIQPPKYGAFHQVIPAIAGKWDLAPDKKTYIFELDPNARFHNGRQITAADVKYSFERAANPNMHSSDYWAVERLHIKGLKRYQAACRAGIKEPHLLGVEVIDHNIVQLHLEQGLPYALELLALPVFSVVPAEDVERWWKDYRTHPVGAGPYTVDELGPGKDLNLKRFDGYYEASYPRTESLHFDILPQPKEQFLAFTRRELDHAPLPADFFNLVMNDPVWNPVGETRMRQAEKVANLDETHVLKTPSWTTNSISMDNQAFPFNELKVRQAFNYAIDKRYIIHHIMQSYAQPVTGVFPPGFPGATRREAAYEYNPEMARKLLFEAGWRDKDGDGDYEPWQNPHLDLTLYYQDNENSYLMCRKIQSDLAAIGVSLDIAPLKNYSSRQMQPPTLFHNTQSPEFIDPSQLFYPQFHSSQVRTNLSHYNNPRVDELVGYAEDLTYEPRRYDLYQEAERLIMDDAPWIFLYHPVNYHMVQPRVSAFTYHPSLPFAYERYNVGIKTAGR